MRGGMGYSAQGTGITSGMDAPRPRYYGGGTIGGGTIMGNMMGNRTGFQKPMSYEDKMKELSIEEQEIVKTPEGTDMYDVISSFGTYANMRNPDGTYKTTGEAGFEQAEQILGWSVLEICQQEKKLSSTTSEKNHQLAEYERPPSNDGQKEQITHTKMIYHGNTKVVIKSLESNTIGMDIKEPVVQGKKEKTEVKQRQ